MDEPYEIVIPTAPEDTLPSSRALSRTLPGPSRGPPGSSVSSYPSSVGPAGTSSTSVHDCLNEEEGFFVCNKCNIKFPDSSSHFHSWHEEICREVAQEGLPQHSFSRNYSCQPCAFNTTSSKVFLFHFVDLHRKNWKIFACNLCVYASRWKCKVLRHRRMIHALDEPKFEPALLRGDRFTTATTLDDRPVAGLQSVMSNQDAGYWPPSDHHQQQHKSSTSGMMSPSPSNGSGTGSKQGGSPPNRSDDGGARSNRRKPQVVRKIMRSQPAVYPPGGEGGERPDDMMSDSDEFYSDTELEQHHQRQQRYRSEQRAASTADSTHDGEGMDDGNNDRDLYRPVSRGQGSQYGLQGSKSASFDSRRDLGRGGYQYEDGGRDSRNYHDNNFEMADDDDHQPLVIDEVPPDSPPRQCASEQIHPRQIAPASLRPIRPGPPPAAVAAVAPPTFKTPNSPIPGANGPSGPAVDLDQDQVVEVTINGEILYRCRFCPFTNRNRWKTTKHTKSIHTERRVYDCKECKFVTHNRVDFFTHKAYHSPKGTVRCSECNYTTSSKTNMERHRENHRKNLPVKCLYCTFSSTGEAAIQRHMAECHDLEDKVVDGGEVTERPKDMSLEGSWPSGEDSQRRSSTSDHPNSSRPSSAGAYADSVRKADTYSAPPKRPLSATSTGGEGPSKKKQFTSLQSQEKESRSSPTDSAPQYTYMFPGPNWEGLTCTVCSYGAKCPSDRLRHNKVHSSVKSFDCSYCDKRYKYRGDLNVHVRRAHPGGDVQGAEVGQSYGSSPSMVSRPISGAGRNSGSFSGMMRSRGLPTMVPMRNTSHLLTPGMQKPHSHVFQSRRADGTFAPKSFTPGSGSGSKWTPSSHSGYSASKGFPRTSSQPSSLSAGGGPLPAVVSRHPVGPYECPACPYSATTNAQVEEHVTARHRGEKAYSCPFCDLVCSQKERVADHVVKKHRGELLSGGGTEPHDQAERLLSEVTLGKPKEAPSTSTLTETSASLTKATAQPRQQSKPTAQPRQQSKATAQPRQQSATAQPRQQSASEEKQEEGLLKCESCPYQTTEASELEYHVAAHENIKLFMCTTCGKRANYVLDIQDHIQREHSDKAWVETITLEYQEAKSSIAEYERQRQQTIQSKMELGGKQGVRPFKCGACPLRSNWKSDVKKHIKRQHKGDPNIKIIEFSAAQMRKESGSVRNAEPRPKKSLIPNKQRPYRCSLCSRRSRWDWDIKKHIRTVHKGKEGRVLVDHHSSNTLRAGTASSKSAKVPPLRLPRGASTGTTSKSDPRRASTGTKSGSDPRRASTGTKSRFDPRRASIGTKSRFDPRRASTGTKSGSENKSMAKSSGASSSKAGASARKKSGSYQCSACKQASEFQWVINRHIRAVHGEGKATALDMAKSGGYGDSRPFICSLCAKRSNWKWDVKKHLLTVHKGTVGSIYDETTYKETRVFNNTSTEDIDESCEEKIREVLASALTVSSDTGTPAEADADAEMEDKELSDAESRDERSTPMSVHDEERNGIVERSPSTAHVGVWKCSHCSYSHERREEALIHVQEHKLYSAFHCTLCDFSGELENTMSKHLRQEHDETDPSLIQHNVVLIEPGSKQHPNWTSNESANGVHLSADSASMVVHRRNIPPSPSQLSTASSISTSINAQGRSYVCRICEMKTAWKSAMLRHLKDRHRIDPKAPGVSENYELRSDGIRYRASPTHYPSEKRYKCETCPYETDKVSMFTAHSDKHNEVPGYQKCPYCNYWVSAARLLKQHIRLHMAREELEEGQMVGEGTKKLTTGPDGKSVRPRRYQCKDCPYISKSKTDLLYHKQFHRAKSTAPFKCPKCPYWVSRRGVLSQHLKVHKPSYPEEDNQKVLNPVSRSQALPTSSSNNSLVTNSAALSLSKRSGVPPFSVKRDGPPELLRRGEDGQRPTDLRSIYGSSSRAANNTRDNGVYEPMSYRVLSRQRDMEDYEGMATAALAKQRVVDSKAEVLILRDPVNSRPSQSESPQNAVGFTVSGHRKLFRCRYCPYGNPRLSRVTFHEGFHNKNTKNELKCNQCSFACASRTAMGHHHKVHSIQYEGDLRREIGQEVEEDDGLQPPREEEPSVVGTDGDVISREGGFVIRRDTHNGGHTLEKDHERKKYACDKCPYNTGRKEHYCRHITLHGSKQKYQCPYCDYSVPVSNLLDRHKLLHANPSENLLAQQNTTNLRKMSYRSAEIDLREAPARQSTTSSVSRSRDGVSRDNGVDRSRSSYTGVSGAGGANGERMSSEWEGQAEGVEGLAVADNRDTELFYEHIDTHEVETVASNEGRMYRCDRCPFVCLEKEDLFTHLHHHVEMAEFNCRFCDYGSSTLDGINNHEKDHFGGQDPPPHIAAPTVTTGGLGRIYDRVVPNDPEEPELLDLEDFDFEAYTRGQDEKRERAMTRGTFPCKHCGREFQSEQAMKEHEACHEGPP